MENDTVTFVPTIEALLSDVNGHIAHYRELTDANAREIVEYLKQKLFPYHIKVSYEHLSCLERINKAREEFTSKTAQFPAEVRTVLDLPRRFRFILSAVRHKANFQHSLVRQSNGLICSVTETPEGLRCTLTALPPNDLNPRYTHETLDRLLKNAAYDIYEIKDGTTANLYYDPEALDYTARNQLVLNQAGQTQKTYTKGKWVLSTKNAIVADDMFWRGAPYRKVLDDVLRQYPEFSYTALDKQKCYSIGFKHPAYHPYQQPDVWQENYFEAPPAGKKWLREAWLIQSYNLRDGTISTTDQCGLPVQPKAEMTDLAAMMNRVNKALADYIAKPSNVFLGYILRPANKADDAETPDIIIESSLLSEIRHAIYQLPFIPNKEIREKQEQNFKNMDYIVLNSYLDLKKREMFLHLFPQFRAQHERYAKIIMQVTKKIITNLNDSRNRNSRFRGVNPAATTTNEPRNTSEQDRIQMLVKRLEEVVNISYTVNSRSSGYRQDEKVVRNLITHPKYTDIYFQVLHAN